MKQTKIKSLIISILLFIPLRCVPVSAASLFPDETAFTEVEGGYYAPADAYGASLQEAMSKSTPAVPYTRLSSYSNINGRQVINAESFQMIMTEEKACEDWIAGNIKLIVPQGTPAGNAYILVADWLADHCYYDYSAKGLRNAQSAYLAFYQSRGICATYSAAFNSIMSALPIANGVVDYTAANPSHIETRFVNNSRHAWSAWSLDGLTWFQTDATYYDGNGNGKHLEYLVMSPALLGDPYHLGGH